MVSAYVCSCLRSVKLVNNGNYGEIVNTLSGDIINNDIYTEVHKIVFLNIFFLFTYPFYR